MGSKRPNREEPHLPRCGGRTKIGDGFCTKPAGDGTDHLGYGRCAQHGGTTLAGRTAALRDEGREMAARFGGVANTNETAEQILIEEVRRAAAFVRYLEDKIGQWETISVPMAEGGTGLPQLLEAHYGERSTTITNSEHKEWLEVYRKERLHLAAVTRSCIDAGISQRMVEMAQRVTDTDAALLAGAIKAILDRLGLTNEQAALVPRVVPDVMQRVVAGEIVG